MISLESRYADSTAPIKMSTDPGERIMTDVKSVSRPSYADGAWIGFSGQETSRVVLELGEGRPARQFKINYLFAPEYGVNLPAISVRV